MKTLIATIIVLISFFANAASINCIGGDSIKVEAGKFVGYGAGNLITEIPVSFKDLAKFENAKEYDIVMTVYVDDINYSITKGGALSSVSVVGIRTIGNIIVVYTPALCSIQL